MTSSARAGARADLVASVAALRTGDVQFVEGLRRIASLRGALGASEFDPDFMILVAIDSESDHLPNAHGKLMATDEWLAHSIREERELQEAHSSEVLAACERLLARFAGEA